jgi:hypothetical protein
MPIEKCLNFLVSKVGPWCYCHILTSELAKGRWRDVSQGEDGGDASQGEDGGVGDGREGEQSRALEFSVFWKCERMRNGSNVHQRQR